MSRPPDPTLAELVPERRLRRLELTVTRRLDGLLHGQYQGLLPGPGSEFSGSREYRPGEDEVRRMDWSVTARTGVPHVKEVDADRELSTWLLVDGSPSMDFGTATLDKWELAVAAVAAVGLLTAGTGNRLGGYLLGAGGARRVPARPGRTHLLGLVRGLLTAPRPDPADRPPALAEAIGLLDRSLTRRGLVVVISDFLDGLPADGLPADGLPADGLPADGLSLAGLAADGPARRRGAALAGGCYSTPDWERPLRRLGARHQVLAVEITDPRELELPDVGIVTFVDPETGWRREVCTADRRVRERFAAAAAAQRQSIRDALRRAGADHLVLRTDRDWVADLARHVQRQRRQARAPRLPMTAVPAGGGIR
ncbi:DUF58 domain-containing protein [Solwaraspora sp. WMMD1047]|uniref:DUF58 domain-containing protein n=1 Tax=Solwaraspora sp. WMMD1047 TaxID=3016102 RepID=UPI00241754BA|nr:DUF58 domain-containing protein [Solwaraspora sp. WMMD1047]MDG4829434.1 DUF58 domain-containing protein [Solwaraspora sp. WMMD1047]